MPTTPGQIRSPKSSEAPLIFGVLGVLAVVVGLGWSALKLAGGQAVPANPLTAGGQLARGELQWTTAATVWVVLMVVVLGAVATLIAVWWFRRRGSRTRVDSAVTHLAGARDLASLSRSAVTAKAKKLRVVMPDPATCPYCSPGLPIGASLPGRTELFGSFEDMHIDIWGPRQGKSWSRVIPAICEAPGAVLATENKRGNLDHTRYVREQMGRKVWVFDPQGVANSQPEFYWNPLSYVTDEDKAESLAEQFADGSGDPGGRKDPYFDTEGQDLVANLILASALANEPITTVYERLTRRDRCAEAVRILHQHRYTQIAATLEARLALAAKQQDGIFGTALKMVHCLRSRQISQWITTSHGDPRPQLDLHQLVRGGETLYCLSKEGVGSAGPLIAALTVATCEAAEDIATASPGGRLPTPMLCALDEAANVVRWRRLPDLYSHYGSRGITIMTVLQNWSQGERVWGKEGMKQLWGAANIKVYGGNVSEDDFLEFLSKLIGDYDREHTSVSRSKSGDSTSRHISRERIFTVADLQALPRGRAVVLSAGNHATLIETVPWDRKPYAALVEESLRRYDPETSVPAAEPADKHARTELPR
ncbi:TraM recognition domain-containing protein [Williamsia muralis]